VGALAQGSKIRVLADHNLTNSLKQAFTVNRVLKLMTVFVVLRNRTSPTTSGVSLTLVWRRRLRSASTHGLVVPPSRLSTVGDRAFPVAATRVWDSLPDFVTVSTSLPVFKRHLKTVLFAKSYWILAVSDYVNTFHRTSFLRLILLGVLAVVFDITPP